METPSVWTTVDELVAWLQADAKESNLSPEALLMLRRDKITEENGEISEALQGAFSSNPRKGASHTWQDVEKEVCDVILTAMVFLRLLNTDAQQVFEHRLQQIAERSRTPDPNR